MLKFEETAAGEKLTSQLTDTRKKFSDAQNRKRILLSQIADVQNLLTDQEVFEALGEPSDSAPLRPGVAQLKTEMEEVDRSLPALTRAVSLLEARATEGREKYNNISVKIELLKQRKTAVSEFIAHTGCASELAVNRRLRRIQHQLALGL